MIKFLSSVVPQLEIQAMLVLSATLSCAACTDTSGVYVEDDVLYIDGEISEAVAEEFDRKFNAKIQSIHVSSGGGDSSAALDIAEQIQAARLPVTADLICASACAAYIWMAGSKRRVLPDTIVAFHHGATPFLSLYENLGNEFATARPGQKLMENARRERELYAKMGVDLGILYVGNYVRGLRCVHLGKREDGSTSLLPEFKAAGYIPTKAVFSSYGVEVEGQLPETAGDLQGAIERLGGQSSIPLLVLTVEHDAGLGRDEANARSPLARVKPCAEA